MSLQYNVAQLLKSDIGDTREYEFHSDDPLDLDDAVADQISGQVKFTMTNFGILANVTAEARLHLTCARCLDPFQTTTRVQFEDEYLPAVDIATGLPFSPPPSDTAFTVAENHTIDLREALRQNLVVAVEMVPLCRQDCLGLCPGCGANRNTEPCTCPPPEAPGPFAALQTLLGTTASSSDSSEVKGRN